jgi:dienelactone hydrolase
MSRFFLELTSLIKADAMRNSSSRRQFLKKAATLPGLVAGLPGAGDASGGPAVEKAQATAETPISGERLDTLVYSLNRYEKVHPSLSFRAGARGEAAQWQRKLRQRLVESLGGFPAERGRLAPRVLRKEQMDGYAREQILFWSRPELQVFGYLLVPDNLQRPGPVMICLPGHGRGVDDIVGIDKEGKQRKRYGGYQNDFALQCVAHGIAAFAIEQLGFGHRRDDAARKSSPEKSSCQPAAGAALMLGETMAGWRTWDVMRAIDYLETREEIDAKRIGCMGISGGGTVTLYAAAVEPRIRLAFLSGSFCTFQQSIFAIAHCIDNYVPGILKLAEVSDIAGLIAPRPLFVENGEQDSIFPVDGTRLAFEKTRSIYRMLGKEDDLALEVFPGKHEFWGKKGFEFVKRHFSD